MRFHIMTLFPELMHTIFSHSIIGRAMKAGHLEISIHNFRDYSEYSHNRVDDSPYGGGMGMLLMAEPIYNCHQAIIGRIPEDSRQKTVYMSPRGKVLTQEKAEELSIYDDLVILCGHYEGVDERVLSVIADEEISIGDYVLTGGELPCAILVDNVGRLTPGVLSSPECHEKDSISSGLLEHPHYTRPYKFLGMNVPDVLLSGHHANIEKWRREQSLRITAENRPDLLYKNKNGLVGADIDYLRGLGYTLEFDDAEDKSTK